MEYQKIIINLLENISSQPFKNWTEINDQSAGA